MAYLIIAVYLGSLLLLGWLARRKRDGGDEAYFLASRKLSPALTLLTLSATNFSAFTVFGFSGQGYASGFQYYPQMALGTGLIGVMFILIGVPVRSLGRARGLISPSEVLLCRYRRRSVGVASFLVMAALTLPYLAMQPMAAGYVLESLLGIPYSLGAALTVLVILAYTFRSGLRGVALTDALQGLLMPVLMGTVLVFLLVRGGGSSLFSTVAESHPALFVRGAAFSPGIWMGYMLLWIWADPMFPQLFQRFYAASGRKALVRAAWAYPLVTGTLFLLPVTLGVMARHWIPELPEGVGVDRILPLLLSRACPGVMEALLATAGLAALMSTMDSQLLTLSSMFTRDIWEPLFRRKAPGWAGKAMVVILALGGLLLSFRPPESFLMLARETFTGLAALFPVYMGTLYWKRASGPGAVAGVAAGAVLTALFHFGVLRTDFTLPVVFVVSGGTLVFGVASLLFPDGSSPLVASPFPFRLLTVPGLILLAGGGLSLSVFPEGRVLMLPWWVWASMALCAAAALASARLGRWTPEINGEIVSHPEPGGGHAPGSDASSVPSPGSDRRRGSGSGPVGNDPGENEL
jgi:SSS family solute:Na+ symporter